MPKAALCEHICACVCAFKILSEIAGPAEAKFNLEPQWDRGGKFIQMIPVICCSSFEYYQPLGAGAFRRAFTTNVAPQCRAFSRALEIEKLKAPLFRDPDGAGDTNDWCIVHGCFWQKFKNIQALMVVLVTCKNEEDLIKNKPLECSHSYASIFRRSRAANSAISAGIPTKFKLIQAFIVVLVT